MAEEMTREEREEIERDRKLEDSLDESIADMNPRTYFDLVSDLVDSKDDEGRFSKIIVDLPKHYQTLYDDRERQKARAEALEEKNRQLKEQNSIYFENTGRKYDKYDAREEKPDERFRDFQEERERPKSTTMEQIFRK